MIYTFRCDCDPDAWDQFERSIHEGPPPLVICSLCCGAMYRDWKADVPMIDTSACRDHSTVKESARVRSRWDRNWKPETVERKFKENIDRRRREIRDAGGQRGSIKQTHAVPAHLYHGKIRETGDANYWSDPKNLAKHNECKVD